jgi:serine acetyltransferase
LHNCIGAPLLAAYAAAQRSSFSSGQTACAKNNAMKTPLDLTRKLYRFLHEEGVRYCVIRDRLTARENELCVVVERSVLNGLAERLRRFARSEDILLIHYAAHEMDGRECKFAWLVDREVRYLSVNIRSESNILGVCVWRAREFLSQTLAGLDAEGKPHGYFVAPPAIEFISWFLDAVSARQLDLERGEQLSSRFLDDPGGAEAQLERHFALPEVQRVVEAAVNNEWEGLKSILPSLRVRLLIAGLPRRALTKIRKLRCPSGMLIACIGPQGSGRRVVIERISSALAPAFKWHRIAHADETSNGKSNSLQRAGAAGRSVSEAVRCEIQALTMKLRTRFLEQSIVTSHTFQTMAMSGGAGKLSQPDLWLVLDAAPDQLQARRQAVPYLESLRERDECLAWAAKQCDAVVLDAAQPLERVAGQAVAAILEMAAARSAADYSHVHVNRFGARVLLFCCRYRIPVLSNFLRTLFNSEIDCPLPFAPYLPRPYGIVIHANAVIGSGVTIMHQVTIGVKTDDDGAAPVIGNGVTIGAGAKILGEVTVGRGVRVGANAMVTRDVPDHATVAGINTILRVRSTPPGDRTIRLIEGLKTAETPDSGTTLTQRRRANDV